MQNQDIFSAEERDFLLKILSQIQISPLDPVSMAMCQLSQSCANKLKQLPITRERKIEELIKE